MYKKEKELLKFYEAVPQGGKVITENMVKMIVDKLNIKIKGNVLDLGCGHGMACEAVRKMGATPIGVDYTKARIESSKKRFPDIKFVCSDMHKFLETTKKSFDVIMLFDTIEHLEAPRELIERAKKVLTEDGIIISITPLRHVYISHLQVYQDEEDFIKKLSPDKVVTLNDKIIALWDNKKNGNNN